MTTSETFQFYLQLRSLRCAAKQYGRWQTERTAVVFNASGLLFTKISLKNLRHYSPSSFRSHLLTTGRPDPLVSQYCTNNYKQTKHTQPTQYDKIFS